VLGRTPSGGTTRRQFLDEYLHEKLVNDHKPDGSGMLHYVRDAYESIVIGQAVAKGRAASAEMAMIAEVASGVGRPKMARFNSTIIADSILESLRSKESAEDVDELKLLPYGLHHVPKGDCTFDTVLQGLHLQSAIRKQRAQQADSSKVALEGQGHEHLIEHQHNGDDDPEKRLIFSQRLDSLSRRVQSSQQTLQHLYEGRVASLERYVAFCVMFYYMAKACSSPILLKNWDMARSQSNLRVATTASPISASVDEGDMSSRETLRVMTRLVHHLRGFTTHH
jgi:hypothetical protein